MKVTKKLGIAKFAKVTENTFNLPNITTGTIYKVYIGQPNYYWPKGEPCIIDDEGKYNYNIWMVCKTVLYV